MSNHYRSFTTGLSTFVLLLGCSESSDPDGSSGGTAGGNGGTTSVGMTRGGSNSGGTNSGGTNSGGTNSGGTNSGGTNSGGTNFAGTTNAPSGGQTAAGGTTSSTGVGGTSSGGTTASTGPTQTPTCPPPASQAMPEANLPEGYCSWIFAEGLTSPRGMAADEAGQLVVIESGSAGAVTLLWDENGDHINQPSERMRIASTSGLNHGIAIHGGYLYASTATTVYRWPYDGSHAALANRQTVLAGMPSGGHSTRTLVFDSAGDLYISIGSGSNLDANSTRARVVRVDAEKLGGSTLTLSDASVFADGLRNEVGLRFDAQGRLWGVENGSDNLSRSDLGGDIHNDNPAEELNLLDSPGAFYGYPYCFTEGLLPGSVGLGPGTQWAYPSVMNDGTHTDAWCRNTNNVKPPAATMQAHSAPLDILFYRGGSFPSDVTGDAIVTFHGSWNRSTATGYKVMRIPFGTNGMPSGAATPLLESVANGDTGGGWTHRPVSLAMGKRGEVFVTSDSNGLVLAIGHE